MERSKMQLGSHKFLLTNLYLKVWQLFEATDKNQTAQGINEFWFYNKMKAKVELLYDATRVKRLSPSNNLDTKGIVLTNFVCKSDSK